MNSIIDTSIEETFSELISGSLENKNIHFSPAIENYLISIVSDIGSMPHALVYRSVYLNDLIRKGLLSSGEVRTIYLRNAGDAALLVSGIFPDSINSRRIYFNLGDFIAIGQKAYASIQDEPFDELAYLFPELVDVLNGVGLQIKMISQNLNNYVDRRRAIDEHLSRR